MNANDSLPQISAAASHGLARGHAKAQRSDDAGSFADHVKGTPPAQAARAALESRPDLADRPFGAIVSLLARNEELPAPVDAPPAGPSAPEEPASDTADDEVLDQV
ncbi:MAG TPA: hypothetical protein VFE34_00070 [Dongiaceae bacterium]|jgi:hypothetical protein|nr:hypothetical protein [Dongiaceae bacterium]